MAFPTDPAQSAQYASQFDNSNLDYIQATPDIEMIHVTYTHAAPDVAGVGTIELLRLDHGRIKIWPHLSLLAHSAFVATADLDIGYRSYVQNDGTVVAEDGNALFDSIDAGGGALALTLWPAVTGAVVTNAPVEFETAGPGVEGVYQVPEETGLRIFATVDTANIEVGDTIELVIAVSRGL